MQVSGIALAIPVTLIFAAAMLLAWAVSVRSTFYRNLVDKEVAGNRFHSIDGLRGYLALSVAFSHLAVNHQFYATGTWQTTPSSLATFFGAGGVAFFFMITAFLFWNRVAYGKAPFDAVRFLGSRVLRLTPMYLVASSLLIITALALTHFRLNVQPSDIARQISSWLLFTAPGNPDINGLSHTYVANGVFWTLVYEWKFYLLLPLFAALLQTKIRLLVAPVICVCIYLFAYPPIEWLFVAGAAAAALVRISAIRHAAAQSWFASLSLLVIAATIRWIPQPYSASGAAMLFVPFLAVAAGNSFFGLLVWRPARLLGAISYSFYLLHSWVLYLVYRGIDHFFDVNSLPLSIYWLAGLAVVILTILLSEFTFRFIEAPFMNRSPADEESSGTSDTARIHAVVGSGR